MPDNLDIIALERWLHAELFPRDDPRYLVAEATAHPLDPRDTAGPEHHTWISSTDGFSVAGTGQRLSPVPESALLLGATSNTVHVAVSKDDRNVLELAFSLVGPPTHQPDQLGEFDLYCDARSLDVLEAFQALGHGLWPREIVLPPDSREVWPRFGIRPVWSPRLPHSDPGPAEVANVLRHPYDARFLRLPLGLLSAGGSSSTVVRVDLGADARTVAERLHERVKLNHVLFWNRAIGLADRTEHIDALDDGGDGSTCSFNLRETIDGPAVLILECWDQGTGRTYCDSRWAGWADPLRCFRTRGSELSDRDLVLDFAGPVPEQLAIAFLLAAPWGDRDVVPGETVIARAGRPRFIVRTSPIDINTNDADSSGRLLAASWIARGAGALPGGAIRTRAGLLDMVDRLMPGPIREALGGDPRAPIGDRVSVANVLRAAGRPDGMGVHGHAYPTTEVALRLQANVDPESVSHRLEWLERTLEKHCPVGTNLRVVKAIARP